MLNVRNGVYQIKIKTKYINSIIYALFQILN